MNDNKKNILSIRDVYKTYKIGRHEVPVLRGVNLDLLEGEWLCLLGASGSGKTTLLNLIGTLEKPDKGTIYYKGIDMLKLSNREKTKIRAADIGYVFQAYHLLPELTILENVRLSAMLNGNFNQASKINAEQLLEQVGLKDRLKHRPTELSGGEQQRVAIARALINNPTLILADEPTGNLDSNTGSEILELFVNIHKIIQKTIIMVTHNESISKLADRVVNIKDGVVI